MEAKEVVEVVKKPFVHVSQANDLLISLDKYAGGTQDVGSNDSLLVKERRLYRGRLIDTK